MPRRITTTTLLLLVALLSLSSMALAFTTTTPTGPSSSTAASKKKLPFFSPIRVMSGVSSPAAFLGSKGSVLFLSDEKQETEAGAVAEKPATTPGEGTFYDDEFEPAQKVGISNSMRDRLMREASTGLDSDKKQTNVILYIILGVAVLVILGGAGIFY